MIVLHEAEDLRGLLDEARAAGKSVGLHPTMGALHGGHMANVRRAAAECDVVAVSIFVNPLQFGPGEDFSSYPRDLDGDLEKAEQAGASVVFAPGPMFADGLLTVVRVRELDEVLEGPWRPEHFAGVATIVTKLLALAGPCWAYFGEKDYQQLAIVRRLVADLSLPAVVVGCATVREPDGLALSSRNAYLNDEERKAAPALYWSLLAGKRAIEEGRVTAPDEVREAMAAVVSAEPLLRLGYAAVADPLNLAEPKTIEGEVRLLVSGHVGGTRLIDNVAAGEG